MIHCFCNPFVLMFWFALVCWQYLITLKYFDWLSCTCIAIFCVSKMKQFSTYLCVLLLCCYSETGFFSSITFHFHIIVFWCNILVSDFFFSQVLDGEWYSTWSTCYSCSHLWSSSSVSCLFRFFSIQKRLSSHDLAIVLIIDVLWKTNTWKLSFFVT